MEDALKKKIQELAAEAHSLGNIRGSLLQQLKEIDTRLTQLTGALTELKKLESQIGEQDGKGEDASADQSGVHEGVHETDEHTPSDEDSVQAEEAGVSDNG